MQTPDYIAEAIEAQWGPRCPDFDAECACCLAWARYDPLSAQDTGAIAGVRVKPLQWKEETQSYISSSFGYYIEHRVGTWMLFSPFNNEEAIDSSSYLEPLKAAAQADYSARILSSLEPQERDGWKPIDTAPKDGTWILVSNPKYDHPFVVRWLRDGWGEDDPGPWGTDMGYWAPTHWMPLPAPPHTEGK